LSTHTDESFKQDTVKKLIYVLFYVLRRKRNSTTCTNKLLMSMYLPM